MGETPTDKDESRKALVEKGDLEPNDVSRDVDDVTKCGVDGCYLAPFQRFANEGCFTGVYGIAALITSTLTVYVNSQVTTLERQFGFNSKQTALIMAANDIGFLVFVLFVSYVANMVHIPRVLGCTTILYGISGLACALPHFLYGHDLNLDPNEELTNQSSVLRDQSFHGQLCQYENRSLLDKCSDSGGDTSLFKPINQQAATSSLAIIVIGMMIQGLGKSPRSSFTVTYIDNNTKQVKTGFFVGCIITLSIFGPALAFTVGGLFTRMYVTLQETNLSPRHPRWIGAWWLGYVVFGAIAVVVSFPLFCFPKRMPRKGDTEKGQVQREVQVKKPIYKAKDAIIVPPNDPLGHKVENGKPHLNGTRTTDHNSKEVLGQKAVRQIKDFVFTCWRLWTNPVYLLITFSNCLIIFTVAGTSAYTPKYLERIFDLPASSANYIMALKSLTASCVGTFIGGYLSKRWKLTAYTSLLFTVTVVFLATLLSIWSFFINCDQPETHNAPGSTSSCSLDCQCEDNSYFPVCGSDGRTYYSPCSAGCLTVSDGSYENCTCIEGGMAQEGICPYGCNQIYYYAVASGLRALMGTLAIVPKVTVIIRSVEPRDKPLALGFASLLSSLLGWMLAPVLFGVVIDGICVIWDVKCGVQGRCLLYDNDDFRIRLHAYALVGQVGSLLCQLMALVYARCTGVLAVKVKGEETDAGNEDEEEDAENKGGGDVPGTKSVHRHTVTYSGDGPDGEGKALMSDTDSKDLDCKGDEVQIPKSKEEDRCVSTAKDNDYTSDKNIANDNNNNLQTTNDHNSDTDPSGNLTNRIEEDPSADLTNRIEEDPSADLTNRIEEDPSADLTNRIEEDPSNANGTSFVDEVTGRDTDGIVICGGTSKDDKADHAVSDDGECGGNTSGLQCQVKFFEESRRDNQS